MDGIQVDVVLAAVRELLDNRTGVAQTGA